MNKRKHTFEREYSKFYLPSLVVIILMGFLPLILLFSMSFVKLSLGKPWAEAVFVGLENWKWLLTDPQRGIFNALKKTAIFCIGSVSLEFILGIFTASLLYRRIRGAMAITTMLIIPTVLTPSMVGMVWRLYFTNNSIIDYLFNFFLGLDINWMSAKTAMISLIWVSVWQYTPFWIVTLLAAMKLQPKAPFEAAIVDGASEWQQFRFITIPNIMPIIRLLVVLRFMQNIIGFDMIYALTGGGPGTVTEVLSIFIYRLNFFNKAVGPGAMSSFFMLMIIAVISLILIKLLPSEEG